MTSTFDVDRAFIPGTTGWTAEDLENPEVERQWFEGRYEIISGVLALRPPGYFPPARALCDLLFVLRTHLRTRQIEDDFACGVDIVIDDNRVVVPDAIWMTADDQERQEAAAIRAGNADLERTRILVPPTVIIESITPGFERHDEHLKRRWYAEFRVPNYWILNAFTRSLECLVLDGGEYRTDAEGSDRDELHPTLFPGLTIPLSQLWLK